jgi:hypothetical protein
MKNKIYKVNGKYILADNSTEAINKLRKTGEYRKIDCDFICDTEDIIPTTELGKMILFEVTDNEVTEFITATDASISLEKFWSKHKSITSYTKVICFLNELL